MVRTAFPAWLIGVVASTAAVVALERVALGLFTSFGGIAMVAVAAFVAGTTAVGIADPDQFARNSSVVAFYIVLLAAVYFLVLPALGDPEGSGARGGSGVYPPPQRGGSPAAYPPVR
jgi:hypothetical protein